MFTITMQYETGPTASIVHRSSDSSCLHAVCRLLGGITDREIVADLAFASMKRCLALWPDFAKAQADKALGVTDDVNGTFTVRATSSETVTD